MRNQGIIHLFSKKCASLLCLVISYPKTKKELKRGFCGSFLYPFVFLENPFVRIQEK